VIEAIEAEAVEAEEEEEVSEEASTTLDQATNQRLLTHSTMMTALPSRSEVCHTESDLMR